MFNCDLPYLSLGQGVLLGIPFLGKLIIKRDGHFDTFVITTDKMLN